MALGVSVYVLERVSIRVCIDRRKNWELREEEKFGREFGIRESFY